MSRIFSISVNNIIIKSESTSEQKENPRPGERCTATNCCRGQTTFTTVWVWMCFHTLQEETPSDRKQWRFSPQLRQLHFIGEAFQSPASCPRLCRFTQRGVSLWSVSRFHFVFLENKTFSSSFLKLPVKCLHSDTNLCKVVHGKITL